jgi:hypothetical protein
LTATPYRPSRCAISAVSPRARVHTTAHLRGSTQNCESTVRYRVALLHQSYKANRPRLAFSLPRIPQSRQRLRAFCVGLAPPPRHPKTPLPAPVCPSSALCSRKSSENRSIWPPHFTCGIIALRVCRGERYDAEFGQAKATEENRARRAKNEAW